jgi:hypothetical protein
MIVAYADDLSAIMNSKNRTLSMVAGEAQIPSPGDFTLT